MARTAQDGGENNLEKAILALGLGYSLVITWRIWALLVRTQPIWPFPALYLLEGVLLPGVAALSAFRRWPSRTTVQSVSAGAMASFSLLGAWSIGLAHVPLTLLLAAGAIIGRRKTHESSAKLILYFVLAGVAQGVAMLALVQLH